MSVGGLILSLAFLIVVVAIVGLPLLRTSYQNSEKQLTQSLVEELAAQHQATINSLRDLDFDFQTGKLTDADYQFQRELLLQQGTEILRQLDAHRPSAVQQRKA